MRQGGQRILLPSGKDGYVYQNRDQGAIDRFIRNFNWSAVKNYTIKIVFGRQECAEDPRMGMCSYDNEIELYDMCGKWTYHPKLRRKKKAAET